jgi:hypothetical protein
MTKFDPESRPVLPKILKDVLILSVAFHPKVRQQGTAASRNP